MKLLTHLLPNFFPGKKLKAKDMLEQVQHVKARTSDIVDIITDTDHYGLVYNKEIQNDLMLHGKTLEIPGLAALTPGGMPIAIQKGKSPELFLTLPNTPSQKKLEVYVVAENSNRLMSEKDSFASYCYPSYRIALSPLENTEAFNHSEAVKIGETIFHDGDYTLVKYLPPVMHLKANPILWSKYLTFKDNWNELYKFNRKLIRLNLPKENPDRQALYRLAEAIDTYMSGLHLNFNSLNEKSSPKDLFFCIAGLGNIIHSKLQTMHQKNQLFELMAKYSDTQQGYKFLHFGFEEGVNFSDVEYDHENLDEMMENITIFFDVIKIVWKRLAHATDHVPVDNPKTYSY